MGSTIARDRIRIAADASSAGNLIDALTGSSPAIWRGADTQFEIGVFYAGNIAVDITNFESITAEIKSLANPAGPALVTKVVAKADMTQSVLLAAWRNQTAQHAVVQLTNSETNLDLEGSTSKQFWLVLGVTTTDDPELYFPIGAGTMTVYESGFAQGDAQISADTPPVRVAELLVQSPDNGLYYYLVPRVVNGIVTPSFEGDGIE